MLSKNHLAQIRDSLSITMDETTMNKYALPALLASLLSPLASTHGSMEVPISRILSCSKEGPENPKSAACQAAVATSGPQMLYDWSGVNQLPNGNHQAFVPDGQLCAGGKSNYAGMNLARSDWPATPIAADANGQFDFIYTAPAPHQTRNWQFFITKNGWNPNKTLAWSDLEDTPFCTLGNTTAIDKKYTL